MFQYHSDDHPDDETTNDDHTGADQSHSVVEEHLDNEDTNNDHSGAYRSHSRDEENLDYEGTNNDRSGADQSHSGDQEHLDNEGTNNDRSGADQSHIGDQEHLDNDDTNNDHSGAYLSRSGDQEHLDNEDANNDHSGADQSRSDDDDHTGDEVGNVDETNIVITSEAVGAVSSGRNYEEPVETRNNEDRPGGDDQSWWQRHVRTDNNHKFCCTLCKYTQTSMSALKRHVSAVHLGFKPFACKHCNFSAMSKSSVRGHINTKHPGLDFGFVRRKYSERDCGGVHISGVGRRSTTVGRRNTLTGALSINQIAAIAAAAVFGSMTKNDVSAHSLSHHPSKDEKVNEDRDHSRSISILETHGDVHLVGIPSSDNPSLSEVPTSLQEQSTERCESHVAETSGVTRLAACDTSGGETKVPTTTSMMSRTNVRQNNTYGCMKCEFSSERRHIVRDHVACAHLATKRFGCPYCTMEHSLSNSIRKHIKTSHPRKKVHFINPMMHKLQLISSHITFNHSQHGVNATALSDTPKLQRRKKQRNGSSLKLQKNVQKETRVELRENARMETRVGHRSTTTLDVEPTLNDTSGTCEDGQSTKSHSSSSDTPESNGNVTNSSRLPEGRLDSAKKSPQNGTDRPTESKALSTTYLCIICKRYTTSLKLKMLQHIATEIDYLPFMCPHCPFRAHKPRTVRHHIKNIHPNLMGRLKFNKDDAQERRVGELLKTSVVARDADVLSASNSFVVSVRSPFTKVICGHLCFALVHM